MIRIVCPSCHASLPPGGLSPVVVKHEPGLACPLCTTVIISAPAIPDRCEVAHES